MYMFEGGLREGVSALADANNHGLRAKNNDSDRGHKTMREKERKREI
jgi:hypothetical protein